MNGKPSDVPSLDALRDDPSKVDAIPSEVAKGLSLETYTLAKALEMRAIMGHAKADSPPPAERWLTVEQASEMFGVTPEWLKKNKKRLPHSQPSRKRLLFPELKLSRWFAAQKAT